MAADDFPLDLDLDESLFDFDDTLLSSSDTLAELDAALEMTMETVQGISVPEPAPAARASFTPPVSPAPLSPQQVEASLARRSGPAPAGPERAGGAVGSEQDVAAPATGAAGLLARLTASPLVAACALGSLALNLVLALYVVSALSAVRTLARDGAAPVSVEAAAPIEEPSAPALDLAPQRGSAPFLAALDDPGQLERESEHALGRARSALDDGEFERARQVLCGLLSVADRIPADSRRDIEARARFLLADSWRLEADAHESALAHAALELRGGQL